MAYIIKSKSRSTGYKWVLWRYLIMKHSSAITQKHYIMQRAGTEVKILKVDGRKPPYNTMRQVVNIM